MIQHPPRHTRAKSPIPAAHPRPPVPSIQPPATAGDGLRALRRRFVGACAPSLASSALRASLFHAGGTRPGRPRPALFGRSVGTSTGAGPYPASQPASPTDQPARTTSRRRTGTDSAGDRRKGDRLQGRKEAVGRAGALAGQTDARNLRRAPAPSCAPCARPRPNGWQSPSEPPKKTFRWVRATGAGDSVSTFVSTVALLHSVPQCSNAGQNLRYEKCVSPLILLGETHFLRWWR